MRNYVLLLSLFLASATLAQTRTYDTLPNLPEHYAERYEVFKKEPIVMGQIIMVGNSITEGGHWKVLLNDSTIINRGISGDVTFGVLNRLKEITDRKPSKLFLLIGINDLSRNTPDEVIIKNIFVIVEKIQAASPSTTIYVQSIFPTNESFKNLNEKFVEKSTHIITVNKQLSKHAEERKYVFVDLYSYFIDDQGRMNGKFTSDGLHLTPAGYAQWTEILKKGKYL